MNLVQQCYKRIRSYINRSLRLRLTLGYTGIFGLILLIFAAVSYGSLAHSMDAALNTTLNDLAVRLASTYHSSDGQIH